MSLNILGQDLSLRRSRSRTSVLSRRRSSRRRNSRGRDDADIAAAVLGYSSKGRSRSPSLRLSSPCSRMFVDCDPRSPAGGTSRAGTDWTLPARSRGGNIRRWDGVTQTTVAWDGLRRDPDLWDPDGDCLVYLHSHGGSQRGPSFRLSYDIIRASNSVPLLNKHSVQTYLDVPSYPDLSSRPDNFDPAVPVYHELFVPAPAHMNREQSFDYHLATRNFFAWMFCKPIVGRSLGEALLSLWRRLVLFRSADEGNRQDILDYVDEQAYSDFRECPDHALGLLCFAEELQLHDLWTDAFVHCVGMNDRLVSSSGFELVSRTTKALITRAKLEMDIRIGHAERQLTTFLDDELSNVYLGLGDGARAHLDHFRSFLHAFYVAKFGYWPPQRDNGIGGSAVSKATYFSMYSDFRYLYAYLMDDESTGSIEQNRPPSGGLCVLQNVMSFDRRHRYMSLPHPLPLVPENLDGLRGQRPFGQAFSKSAKMNRRVTTLAALSAATNAYDVVVMRCPLVRAYMWFERESTLKKQEERVSAADARKVRWLLIYAVLQTLISVTKAPKEVRDTEGVTYHLCCQTAGTPPWTIQGGNAATTTMMQPDATMEDGCKTPKAEAIRPDLEYLMDSRSSSTHELSAAAKQSPTGRRPLGFCEILVPGYGNGLNVAEVETTTTTTTPSTAISASSSSEEISPRWSGLSSVDGDGHSGDIEGQGEDRKSTLLPSMDHFNIPESTVDADNRHHSREVIVMEDDYPIKNLKARPLSSSSMNMMIMAARMTGHHNRGIEMVL